MSLTEEQNEQLNEQMIAKVASLLKELEGPIFAYRMTHVPVMTTDTSWIRSAKTRKANAAARIDDIVQRYVTGGLQ